MSILTQNNTDEKALLDCIQRFFSNHHVGMILKKCNGTKEKGVPSISLLRYKLGNIFVGEYSRAVTPQVRQAGNRLSGLTETAYTSLLA